jgi:ribosomal protein S12 methylthiotransferase accessory factor
VSKSTLECCGTPPAKSLLYQTRSDASRVAALTARLENITSAWCFVQEGWGGDAILAAQLQAWKETFDFVPVQVDLGEIWVGPVFTHRQPGCIQCLLLRRAPLPQLRAAIAPGNLGLVVVDLLAELIRRDVETLLLERASYRAVPTRRVIVRSAFTGFGKEHRLLPVGLCPICGPPTGQASQLALAPVAKTGQGFRSVMMLPTDELENVLVDERIGVLARVTVEATEPQVIAAASLPLPEYRRTEFGVGRAQGIEHARGVAIIEALERFAGLRPRRALPYVEACYKDIDQDALNPNDLILHEPEQYREDGFRFHEFSEDLRLRWIAAFSLTDQRPILVPQHSAYYGLPDEPGNPQLAYELSNGCASGYCLEEAILHGALEVVERDAFLMAWYSSHVGSRIDLSTSAIPQTHELLGRLAQRGYEVWCFDITQSDLAIPAVWLFARATAPGQPSAACAVGASLDMDDAIERSVRELASNIRTLENRLGGDPGYPVWLAENFSRVRAMEDHALVYAVPDARRPLSFLERACEQPPEPVRTRVATNDLLDDLHELIASASGAGVDLVVVDQTSPEHESVSLRCARVLIPGLLPMTFGQGNRRLSRARRLQVLASHAINAAPHPFP